MQRSEEQVKAAEGALRERVEERPFTAKPYRDPLMHLHEMKQCGLVDFVDAFSGSGGNFLCKLTVCIQNSDKQFSVQGYGSKKKDAQRDAARLFHEAHAHFVDQQRKQG